MKKNNYTQPTKTRQYIDHIFQTSFEGSLKTIAFDVVSIEFPVINEVFCSQEDILYSVHQFQQGEIVSAYEPFLEVIREWFKDENSEQLTQIFTELGLYPLQIPMFVNYVTGTTKKRHTEILREEVYYEKIRLIKGIVSLLAYISMSRDCVIFLDHLHFATAGTLEIIEALLQSDLKINMLLLLAFDATFYGDNDDNLLFDKVVEELESRDLVIRLESTYFNEDNYVYTKPLDEDLSIKIMDDCIAFLAIDDCIRIGNILYTAMNSENREGRQEQYYHVLRTIGKAYYFQRDKEASLFYDNMALSIAIELNNDFEICDTKIQLGYNYAIRADHVTARKYVIDALELAQDLRDEKLIYKCHFLNFIIDKDSLHINRRVSEENLVRLIEETKRYGYDNYLSLIYTNPYELHNNFTQEKEDLLEQGISIIEKNDNEHQLGNAFHNWGVAYSVTGNMEKAYVLYRRSQIIKEKIHDNRRVAFIYNSLGYYYTEMEQYVLAHEEYIKSLKASLASRDYHEMGMTLYNILLNAFLYEAYSFACDIAHKLIKLLSVTKIQNLKYHSKKMIYNIYIIALIKCNQESKALDTYNKVILWGIEEIEDKNEELFMSKMVEFYIAKQLTDKETYLMMAEKLVPVEDKAIVHFRNFCLIEKIQYYKQQQQNYYVKVVKLLNEELTYQSAPYTKARIQSLMQPKFKKSVVYPQLSQIDLEHGQELSMIDVDFERILFTAKMDNNLLKLHHRINQINFLNLVQTMLFNQDDKQQLILNLQQLIHGNTKVEKTYCRQIVGSSYEKVNLDNALYVINEVYSERIFGYIKDKSQAAILHFGNTSTIALKKVYGYSSLMYLPIYCDKERIIELLLMTQRKDEKFNQDDLNLYNLIARQAGEALSRITRNRTLQIMNQKLEQIYVTDVLTWLSNRNALEIQLQKEQQDIQTLKTQVLFCMFIDLDNFKYYNDTFGHNIGDQILTIFGEILRQHVSPNDFVARYGGDEFVVLLKDSSRDVCRKLAHKIYASFEEHHYFEELISDTLNRTISIPMDNRISCSMGVATSQDIEDNNVYALLKLSDLALYTAKNRGKSTLVFHEER